MSELEKLIVAKVIVTEAQRPFGGITMFMLKALALVLSVSGIFALCGRS